MTTGEIVQLKSGGPKMTIQRVIGTETGNLGLKAADEYLKLRGFTDGDVVCQWFEQDTLRDGTFKISSLLRIED